MKWNADLCRFIAEHLSDDLTRLLLSAHRYPDIDVTFAVEQIEARRRLRTKLPEWYALPELIMGGRVPAEQCSSEQTARFKRSVMLSDARSLCDMTGGMGVDFWYMSQGLDLAIYNERQSHLCEAARHNFDLLSRASSGELPPCRDIQIREGLSTSLPVPDVDVLYLDPARRSQDGSRIYEISDCEPDVVAWQQDLLAHCRQLIIKVSPMADISRTLSRLVNVTDVYVVSVKGECKELLVVQRPSQLMPADGSDICIHCVDFYSSQTITFDFRSDQMGALPPADIATEVGPWFYEPDVSVMKAQGFRALAEQFDVKMLDADCHYFTSSQLVADFPGRIFSVDRQIEFSSRLLKQLGRELRQANIATRHFPLSPEELKRRTGMKDGGEVYLFGASLHNQGPVLLQCSKFNALSHQ